MHSIDPIFVGSEWAPQGEWCQSWQRCLSALLQYSHIRLR